MTSDVLVSIFGIRRSDENEEVEAITTGKYQKKSGVSYISCELTQSEEEGGNIKYLYKITPERVEIVQRGYVKSTMVFEAGKTHFTSYLTPVGELALGIETKSLSVTEEEDLISVNIKYCTELNEEHFADSNINLKIRSLKRN